MACVMNYSCFKSTERTRPHSPKIPHYKNEKRERGREGTGERERGRGVEGREWKSSLSLPLIKNKAVFSAKGGCVFVYISMCVLSC